MVMKSNKPLFLLLAGYIFSLLVFLIWYYTIHISIMEVIIVVVLITALYLLLFYLILFFSSLQKPWKSFLLVSIITLATLFLIQNVYHKKYRLVRAEEIIKTQLIKEISIRNLETKIADANKTITILKERLLYEQNENGELRKQLNELIRKTKFIEEEQKPKRDVVIQKISYKDFSKINSEAVNGDSDTKRREIIFKVQILSSSIRLQKTSQQFRGFKNIGEYKDNDLYKYTIGKHKDLKSAYVLQTELRSKGFNGAFVVSFNNGKRIPVREAQRLLN